MSLSVDLYVPAESWLHQLDPRVKLWGTVVGTILVFLLPDMAQPADATHPWGALAALALLSGVIALLLAGRIPVRQVRWVLRGLLPVTILILLIQPWFVIAGREIAALGPAHLTTGGLSVALTIAIRANALALLALLPLFTTRHDDLVRGLVQLGLPYTWGLTITLALRYIPIAAGLFTTIRQAQEARGLDLSQGGLFRRVRQFVPVLTALVIASVRLSDQLAMAMAARGLGAGQRTERRVLVMARADWLAALLLTAALLAVIGLRVLLP